MEKEHTSDLKSILGIILIALLAGFFLGVLFSTKYFDLRVSEAVEMKRFLYNKQVYDIMHFDRTGK